MFKFAANKFSSNHNNNNNNSSSHGGHQNSSGGSTSASGSLPAASATKSSHSGDALGANDSSTVAYSSARRRCQIQKDLFSFNKIADKGFPSKPSAMDYDKKLRLLAIGTKNGDIRIYGEPHTPHQQLSCYQDVHPFPILKLLFVQGQYQLITLSERVYRNDMTNKGESNFYLILWQIPNLTHSSSSGGNLVEKIKEYQLEPKIVNNTRLSALTLLNDNSHLFIGFETGDVYVFNVSSFQMVPGVINKDYILKNLPVPGVGEMKKLTSLGAVESICHHPRQLTKLLIAYQRGLWIIFDFIKNQIEQINQTQQQLESAVFYQHGECVATSHSDGSFILWDLSSTTPLAPSVETTPVSTLSNVPSSCSSSSAPNIVYGPYPCKAVNKCLVKTCRNDQPYVIFSGGCPRVNYSDKITITVIQGENAHVCFDFTSKIIDFFTIDKPSIEKQQQQQQQQQSTTSPSSAPTTTIIYDNPQALFVLLEEEFVAIDLVSENWPQYKLPYLCSVHSSAIICTHYANNVAKQFYERLKYYGTLAQDPSEIYSEREWPIGGSSSSAQSNQGATAASERRDLLLTGHEDGSIRFWDVTNMSMTLIYRLKTSDYFQTDSTPMPGMEDQTTDSANGTGADADNWPPFRKVGTFDPYSDDPKLGIQKIFLCPRREIIVVAGTAGQVLIMSLHDQMRDLPYASIDAHKINIIGVSPEVECHFVWKGHEPLMLRGHIAGSAAPAAGSLKLLPGYQLHSLIQLYPPATVSALALNTDWQLVAMGTSHGFALFDYAQGKDLLIRCTLDPAMLLASNNPNDSGNAGTTISRRKSLKKSLRESFRKLRRGRSQKPNANKAKQANDLNGGGSQMAPKSLNDDDLNDAHHKPIERQVESREFKPVDDIPPSVIRYMYFVRTYITSGQQQTNSLWVGTNTGIIYIYALQFLLNSSAPAYVKPAVGASNTLRSNQLVNCLLAKEMRLKHRAPVVHIQVIDQNMHPLPNDNVTSGCGGEQLNEQISTNSSSSSNANHKVIICSEEQFKVFQLPTLKPVCKFKLTAVEGARVRRIGYNCYISKNDAKYSEYCLSCLSNLGDISVYSLPNLKRQVQIQCMKQQDINAITSFVFSKQGQAFYLQSASEFVHISMSARDSPQLLQFNIVQKQQQPQQTPKTSTGSTIPAKPRQANSPTTPLDANNKQPPQQQQQQQATLNKPHNQTSTPANTTTNVNANTTTTSSSLSTATNNSHNTSSQIVSPKSPPPPVPAPRTTITTTTTTTAAVVKEEPNRNVHNNENPKIVSANNGENVSSEEITADVKEQQTLAEKQCVDQQRQNLSVNTEPVVETSSVSSPLKTPNQSDKQQQQQLAKNSNTPTSDLTNTSLITGPNGAAITSTSTLAAYLNQSNVSGNNPVNPVAANCSLSTGQSDSFNASSSGYNGSSSYMLNTTNAFNLSMDSVVDKFSDEFNHVLSKKIPSSIDEDGQVNGNDSLLNDSHNLTANVSRLTLNGHGKAHEHTNGASTNGAKETNGTGAASVAAATEPTNGYPSSAISPKNGHLNGSADNHSAIDMAPKKASSPLIKLGHLHHHHHHHHQNGHQNGHILNIEQVTKRIENGSKLEYRETAID